MNNIFRKKMKYIFHIRSNEKGSTLLLSVLILLLLTIIGIAATNTSTIEILISGNDKFHKMAFHQADGGTEVGIGLVEQSWASAGLYSTGDVNATNPNLYMNSNPGTPPFAASDAHYGGNGTRTNLRVGGNPQLSTGSAIQMAAGYEGIGKGTAGSGGRIVYDIWSQHIGVANSEAMILLQWMHVM
jgi:hypothetical protein